MPNTIRNDIGAIFVSLELSRSKWLITSLSPGGGEKMSKHTVPGGDICALLARFSELQRKALARRNVSTTLRQPAFEFKLGFSAFGLAG